MSVSYNSTHHLFSHRRLLLLTETLLAPQVWKEHKHYEKTDGKFNWVKIISLNFRKN